MIPQNLKYEKELYDKGIRLIAGVDEVGRGPLAGPIVAGAVILDLDKLFRNNDVMSDENPKTNLYLNVNDSKLITEKKRQLLNTFIQQEAISYAIFEVSSQIIDAQGIGQAAQMAFFNAIKSLSVEPEFILIDAFKIRAIDENIQLNIIKGDSLSMTIGAASIIAKVYRDSLMDQMHTKYPQYGFDKHKGYGTAKHLEVLRTQGPCEIHRTSFEPIRSYLLG